jgi:hypothetical protein
MLGKAPQTREKRGQYATARLAGHKKAEKKPNPFGLG